jgi:site-specific DNA-methyltransferase (cytosine-N4-specific)
MSLAIKGDSMSSWLDDFQIHIGEPGRRRSAIPVYQTSMGAMYCGRSEKVLFTEPLLQMRGQVQLVITSPPFPLVTKKAYGNKEGAAYTRWLGSFAPMLGNLLTDDGSVVIEIGNVWESGRPVMSTVVMEALLRFLKRGGFNLCQEFIWYNPAKLPSPAQWVNIERSRVKDAFSRIWWMSRTDKPKADNKNVLKQYSESMEKLLKTGTYNGGKRPSEHSIGAVSFNRNNGGAIPPNVFGGDDIPPLSSFLKASNTRSSDQYQLFCRADGHKAHPARMPMEIVDFFVRMLTDEGDTVLDPFAGSNTTGALAESRGRRWVGIEANWDYAASSMSRFAPEAIASTCSQITVTPREAQMTVGTATPDLQKVG